MKKNTYEELLIQSDNFITAAINAENESCREMWVAKAIEAQDKMINMTMGDVE